MSTPVPKKPRTKSTAVVNGKQEFRSNIGQTLINVSSMAVEATGFGSDMFRLLRKEVNEVIADK